MRKKSRSHATAIDAVSDELSGLSYSTLFFWWLAATFLFGCVYFLLSFSPGNGAHALSENANVLLRFFDALYFSIVTGTSTGYGDIVPLGFSKAFAALQSMSSIVLIALFVAKFSSRRQEIALAHIHELTFDNAFHSIRQGLFIARKDLDLIMKKVEGNEALSQKDWRDLRIAFRQMEIFIRKITDFYASEDSLYEVDIDRERLLLDAVERTLDRVVKSLKAFDAAGISYIHQEGCIHELKNLATITVRVFTPEKEKVVHAESKEAFSELFARVEEILHHIEKYAEYA